MDLYVDDEGILYPAVEGIDDYDVESELTRLAQHVDRLNAESRKQKEEEA